MKGMYWYNYKTGDNEYVVGLPDDFHDYLPQNKSAQALFDLYVDKLKVSKVNAAIKVLKACVGEKD